MPPSAAANQYPLPEGGTGKCRVQDDVEPRGRRDRPAQAAARRQWTAPHPCVGHHAREERIGERNQDARHRTGVGQRRQPHCDFGQRQDSDGLAQEPERLQRAGRPHRDQREHGACRVVGMKGLGHAGDHEQAGRDQVEPDQFHATRSEEIAAPVDSR